MNHSFSREATARTGCCRCRCTGRARAEGCSTGPAAWRSQARSVAEQYLKVTSTHVNPAGGWSENPVVVIRSQPRSGLTGRPVFLARLLRGDLVVVVQLQRRGLVVGQLRVRVLD